MVGHCSLVIVVTGYKEDVGGGDEVVRFVHSHVVTTAGSRGDII